MSKHHIEKHHKKQCRRLSLFYSSGSERDVLLVVIESSFTWLKCTFCWCT